MPSTEECVNALYNMLHYHYMTDTKSNNLKNIFIRSYEMLVNYIEFNVRLYHCRLECDQYCLY